MALTARIRAAAQRTKTRPAISGLGLGTYAAGISAARPSIVPTWTVNVTSERSICTKLVATSYTSSYCRARLSRGYTSMVNNKCEARSQLHELCKFSGFIRSVARAYHQMMCPTTAYSIGGSAAEAGAAGGARHGCTARRQHDDDRRKFALHVHTSLWGVQVAHSRPRVTSTVLTTARL